MKSYLDSALHFAEEGIAKFPAMKWNYVVLGHIYARLGLLSEAKVMYQKALRIQSDLREAKEALEALETQ